eukprot:2533457-Amphidinium_carterae.1
MSERQVVVSVVLVVLVSPSTMATSSCSGCSNQDRVRLQLGVSAVYGQDVANGTFSSGIRSPDCIFQAI